MENNRKESLRRLALTIPIIAVALAGAIGQSEAKQGDRVVAMVLDYQGKARSIHIRRGKKRLPVRIYLMLHDGDEISIKGGTQITLRFTDSSRQLVAKTTSPYRVKARGAGVGFTDKLASLLERVGISLNHKRSMPTSMPTGVRGGANDGRSLALQLRHPGLRNGKAEVRAGKRRLALAWQNGTAPYRVTLSSQGGKTLLDANVTALQLLTQDPRDLTPGAYDIVVADAKGARSTGRFTVVAESNAADAGTDLPSWLGNDAAATIRACAHSQTAPDRSSYDAYLSLIDIETRYQPAKEMRQELANGRC